MQRTLTKVIKYLRKKKHKNGRLFLISNKEQILQYLELIKCINFFFLPWKHRGLVAQWSRFKGFYIQIWGLNPRQCNFYRKRSEFQFPEKANYAENQRKYLQEIFSMAQRVPSSIAQGVPSGMDLIGLLRMMQSGVNPHKTGRIVGCNIVYVMFLIIA